MPASAFGRVLALLAYLPLLFADATPQEGDVTLVDNDLVQYVYYYYYYNDEPGYLLRVVSGRLIVFHDGQWGNMCADVLDDRDGEVACRALGMKFYYMYRNGLGHTWADDTGVFFLKHGAGCSGLEASFAECNVSDWVVEGRCNSAVNVGCYVEHTKDVAPQGIAPLDLVLTVGFTSADAKCASSKDVVDELCAEADFLVSGESGAQVQGVRGELIASGFVFWWVGEGYRLLVHTDFQGVVLRIGYLEPERQSWADPSSWLEGQGSHNISNFTRCASECFAPGSRVQLKTRSASARSDGVIGMCGMVEELVCPDAQWYDIEFDNGRVTDRFYRDMEPCEHLPVTPGIYMIESLNAVGRFVSVDNATTGLGANIQLRDDPRDLEAQWHLNGFNELTLTLESASTLDAYMGNAANVVLSGVDHPTWLTSSWERVRWRIAEASDGVYTLESFHNAGKYLSVESAHDLNGANVGLSEDPGSVEAQWRLHLVQQCDGLSATAGRCGPSFGRCASDSAAYCDMAAGVCVASDAHRDAQYDDTYDWTPCQAGVSYELVAADVACAEDFGEHEILRQSDPGAGGGCEERCSGDAGCLFYTVWPDGACRHYSECSSPVQRGPGEAVLTFRKTAAIGRGRATSGAYEVRRLHQCAWPIMDMATCSLAAAALDLRDVTPEEDGHAGGVGYDPPYCYFEGGSLKFNSAGSNTGACSIYDLCLCAAPQQVAPKAILCDSVYSGGGSGASSLGIFHQGEDEVCVRGEGAVEPAWLGFLRLHCVPVDLGSTMVSYRSKNCGPRGGKAQADLSACPYGASVVVSAHSVEPTPTTIVDGCPYFSIVLFECDNSTSTATSTTTATACVDYTPPGEDKWYDADGEQYDCAWYAPDCSSYGDSFPNFNRTANEACCACGGGLAASSTPVPTAPHETRAPTTGAPGEQTQLHELRGSMGFSCTGSRVEVEDATVAALAGTLGVEESDVAAEASIESGTSGESPRPRRLSSEASRRWHVDYTMRVARESVEAHVAAAEQMGADLVGTAASFAKLFAANGLLMDEGSLWVSRLELVGDMTSTPELVGDVTSTPTAVAAIATTGAGTGADVDDSAADDDDTATGILPIAVGVCCGALAVLAVQAGYWAVRGRVSERSNNAAPDLEVAPPEACSAHLPSSGAV